MVSSVDGFTGNVNLTASTTPSASGFTFLLDPTTVLVKPGTPGTSTLMMSATSATPRALYVLTATGSSGPTLQSLPLTVAVTPITLNVNAFYSFSGVNVTTTGSTSIDSPSTTFTASGSMSVTAKNATTGTTLFAK